VRELAKRIIEGYRLTENDDLTVFETAPLEELCEGADLIRRALCDNKIDLCTIINGRGGRCSEDCKFCAQSAHHHTSCAEFPMLDTQTVLADCRKREADGVHAYSIVTAGRKVDGDDLDQLVQTYQILRKNTSMRLCASHGLLSAEAFARLKDAGVEMYHSNIETSKRYFPKICTTHTWEDKLEEIRLAKEAGLTVCSGGIIGMGETFADRVDMALSLAKLEITSIPINALMPVAGTPLEDLPHLTEDEILRTIAMFRYINPTAYIRMAAGRGYFPDGGKKIFQSGANATITGDMLTTVGNNTAQDKEMLTSMGFEI